MRFGCHVSISPKIYLAVDRAKALGCETFQIFPSNPRGWQSPPLSGEDAAEFKAGRREAGLTPLVVHVPYLVNLASPDEEVRKKSTALFEDSLKRSNLLGADFLVLHPGSHLGDGAAAGIERVVRSLKKMAALLEGDLRILLENTAGSGGSLGSDFMELKSMLEGVGGGERFGVCLDSAHGFAAGYDVASKEGMERMAEEIEASFGFKNLYLIHANDSKGALGSRLDRHEEIGKGRIGLEGFAVFLNHPKIKGLDCILETPKKSDEDDLRNLAVIRSLLK